LTVVDPGVGTHRRPLILETNEYKFVGPDNGVHTYILGDSYSAWELTNPNLALGNPAMTFHGRDIFAPAAAHAAWGTPGASFGQPVKDTLKIPVPKLDYSSKGRFHGEIIHIDRFGNALTSLGVFKPLESKGYLFNPWVQDIHIQPITPNPTGENDLIIDLETANINLTDAPPIYWTNTFRNIPNEKCAFIVGSSGLLEIAADRRSASELLGISVGDPVILSIE
jgi:S-adenosylmethionine hydrolase